MEKNLEQVPYRTIPYINYLNILSCFVYQSQCIQTTFSICVHTGRDRKDEHTL